jgi:hypothetical protein
MGFVLTLKPITQIRTKANVWLRHGSVPNGSQFMTHQPVLNLNGIPSYNPRVASTLGYLVKHSLQRRRCWVHDALIDGVVFNRMIDLS